MHISEGGEAYSNLINNINEEITKSNAIVKAGITRRENDKEELANEQH